MGRTGGEKTRNAILKVSEELFAEKGFDGTSVEDIANKAGVNKALLYYHFKNKEAILERIFEQLTIETREYLGKVIDENHSNDHESEITEIIKFLDTHRSTLTILLMESLKNEEKSNALFKGAELILGKEDNGVIKHAGLESNDTSSGKKTFMSKKQLMIYEFFTGFMPLIAFVIYKDKWAKYFKYPSGTITKDFTKLFIKSHIQKE